MMQQLLDFISYFENSALADSVRENDVLFPLIESVHVLAICLVVGSIFVVDLRSGSLLFISNATKYLENGFFVAKLLLIGAAGLNMAIFHGISAKDQPRWDNKTAPPLSARLAGGLSILLWISVVTCGRWIGFTMEVR
jgi:hypothetical protein